jgi:Ca-activated chloride channel family protein
MNDAANTTPILHLAAGFDRGLAWAEGGSVRHLVVELSADGAAATSRDVPALDLAIAVDVSGSMAGDKLEAARRAAAEVAEAMRPADRLTLVAFASDAEVLLDARPMDAAGQTAAAAAIARLEVRGNTNLFAGWLLGVERLAVAMDRAPRASHRLLLLSDGQANVGTTDPAELARHAGELLARGIITSTVGIGDGYDEALLGAMSEAGGGRLHDVEHAPAIGEVVLGELREGRAAALERARLRLTVPANLRAEVIGPWAHTVLPGVLDVVCGSLLPGRERYVVVRLHCPAGVPGGVLPLGVDAWASPPDATAGDAAEALRAMPVEVALRLATDRDNASQPRDLGRSLTVLRAWQAAVLRKAVRLNREGDHRAARHFLERELHWIERYARGVPGAEPLLAELVLLSRRAEDEWDERTRKEVFAASTLRGRFEADHLSESRDPLADVLRRPR